MSIGKIIMLETISFGVMLIDKYIQANSRKALDKKISFVHIIKIKVDNTLVEISHITPIIVHQS